MSPSRESTPQPISLQFIGSADAAICVDGMCIIPGNVDTDTADGSDPAADAETR